MNRILVTGVNGFIGQRIALHLYELGYPIIGLVRKQEKK